MTRTPSQVNSTLATQRPLQEASLAGSGGATEGHCKRGMESNKPSTTVLTRNKSERGAHVNDVEATPSHSVSGDCAVDPFDNNFELVGIGRRRI